MDYIAVTIARNEEKNIRQTIESVLNQSIPPVLYVVVDDGSTDKTPQIVMEYEPYGVCYVKVLGGRFDVRSFNLCRAVNLGFEVATFLYPEWKYALKVDADSVIPGNYVERLLMYLERDPRIGIISGCIENRKMWRGRPSDGAKMYRRECWNDIGGMDYVIGWDTHGIIKANWMGYKCLNLPIFYRELRTSKRETVSEWYYTGATRYFLGFPLWHTFLVSLIYTNDKPYVLGSLIMFFSHLIHSLLKYCRPFSKEYYAYASKFAINEMLDRLRALVKRG